MNPLKAARKGNFPVTRIILVQDRDGEDEDRDDMKWRATKMQLASNIPVKGNKAKRRKHPTRPTT